MLSQPLLYNAESTQRFACPSAAPEHRSTAQLVRPGWRVERPVRL